MTVSFGGTRTDEYRRVLPHTPPVVDASLWRGVAVGLVPSLAAWYALWRLVVAVIS